MSVIDILLAKELRYSSTRGEILVEDQKNRVGKARTEKSKKLKDKTSNILLIT